VGVTPVLAERHPARPERAEGSRLRIALLNPCYFPEVRRGAERCIRNLADELIPAGHEMRLITSHPGAPSVRVERGLTVHRNRRPLNGLLRLRRFYVTHVPSTYMTLRRGDDDIVHAYGSKDALAGARWSGRTGRPTVFTYVGILSADRNPLMIRLVAAAARRSDVVVADSKAVAEGLWRFTGVDARVIYPGVDLETFRPDPSQRPEAPTILCTSAIDVPRKRVGLLVDAFHQVLRSRPDARLVLQRPGDHAKGEALARGVEGLEFFDPVDDPRDVAALYRRAWISALPSTGEAFGGVQIESLACGTPVVGSDLGAIPEVLDSERIGRRFRGDDPAALAEALLEGFELAEIEETRGHCRRRAEDFSTAGYARAYLEVYREALG
jgi:glycosyltransferase involved in cell wall biosynthesis